MLPFEAYYIVNFINKWLAHNNGNLSSSRPQQIHPVACDKYYHEIIFIKTHINIIFSGSNLHFIMEISRNQQPVLQFDGPEIYQRDKQ